MIGPLFLVFIAVLLSALLFGVGSGLACEPSRPGWPASRIAGLGLMFTGVGVFVAIAWAVS